MEQRTLGAVVCLLLVTAMVPGAQAGHDGDGVPDGEEQLACGFPTIATLVNLLPPPSGECVQDDGDYRSPALGPSGCQGCESTTLIALEDQPFTPNLGVPSIPVPPLDVPPIGPITVPGADQPIGSVVAGPGSTAEQYCVSVILENQGTAGQCFDAGPAGSVLPPVGPVELLKTPGREVGPTPGVENGSVAETPDGEAGATSMDLVVVAHSVPDRLNRRLGPGLVELWEPVDLDDPAEVSWWLDNGNETALTVTVTVHTAEGSPTATVAIPYAGQAAAAAMATSQGSL